MPLSPRDRLAAELKRVLTWPEVVPDSDFRDDLGPSRIVLLVGQNTLGAQRLELGKPLCNGWLPGRSTGSGRGRGLGSGRLLVGRAPHHGLDLRTQSRV